MIPRRYRLRTQLTLLYAVPFFVTGTLIMAVPFVGASNTVPADGSARPPANGGTHYWLNVSAVAVLALAVLSLGVGWLVAGRFLRPLRTITATARDISASNLNRRLDLGARKDEFAELAATLDDLFARLEAAFESQRHFVANASHELRTPLTAERALLQVALADEDPAGLRRACEAVLALGRDQERLIDSLLTLAGAEQGVERRLPFDLAAMVSKSVEERRPEVDRRGLWLTTATAPAPIVGDPQLVGSLVANLLDNAVRHNVPGGRVEVAVENGVLSVGNDGPLVPGDEIGRLFQPFQQLGPERTGHDGRGLGLAIVRAIADAHGATVTANPRPAGGLDLRVTFAPE